MTIGAGVLDMDPQALPSNEMKPALRRLGVTAYPDERLSIPFPLRVTIALFGGFATGASLGLSHGGKMAGMRFRAEHAHIFPTTTAGWYLYHKSKNYHVMLGGLREGLRMGFKVSFWAGSFMWIEEAVDRIRGTKDFVSSVVAGLSTAGAFSAWSERWSLHEVGRC